MSSVEPIGEIKAWPSEIALLGELDGTNNLRRLDHLRCQTFSDDDKGCREKCEKMTMTMVCYDVKRRPL